MIDWTLSVHIVTFGNPQACEATRMALPNLPNVHVRETPIAQWWSGQPHARDGAPDVGPTSAWHLLLFEGERVDAVELVRAVVGGRPSPAPMVSLCPSVAPDAFALLRLRLQRGPVDVEAAVGSAQADERQQSSDLASWSLSCPPASSRLLDPVRTWARDAATALTIHQALVGTGPPVLLAGLLLLAAEWDAVLSRAQAALRASRCPPDEAITWARAGVAAASCGGRWSEANVCWHRWNAAIGDRDEVGLARTWRAVIDVARDEPTGLRDLAEVVSAVPDPWVLVHQRELAMQRLAVAAEQARRFVPVAAASGQLDALVEMWRLAGLAPRELVQSWPSTDVAAIHRGVLGCDGRSAEWWLELASEVLDQHHVPQLADAAARAAARTGFEQALTWSLRGARPATPGPNALALRAMDPDVNPDQRLTAAVGARSVHVALDGLVEAVVAELADEQALRCLLLTDRVAPQCLPDVVRAFCTSPVRTAAMQDALVAVGATEQAEALDELFAPHAG